MAVEKDIFVSYSKSNKEKVAEIVNKITAQGVSCWFQLQDSKQEYAAEISKGIRTSRAFVVFLSNASIRSMYVRSEIAIAFKHYNNTKGYKILPIFIEEVEECDELDSLDIYLSMFNELFACDFATPDDLVAKIFEQLGIVPDMTNVDSIYSAETDAEARRLAIQNDFYNRYASGYIAEAIENMTDICALDVGCSDGANTVLRLADPKFTRVLGVDKDDVMVKKANATHGDERYSFVYADITGESFGGVLDEYLKKQNREYFDFIHVSAVFLHIKTPLFTLKTLQSRLAPGGKIFIVDEDDGLNTVSPDSEFFDDCFFIWSKSLESGDRHMGRKLPLLLSGAGFSDVEVKRTTIASTDFGGEMKEVLWDLYFNPYLWSVPTADYFSDGRAFAKIAPYTAAHDDKKREYMDGKIFIMLGVMFFVATK